MPVTASNGFDTLALERDFQRAVLQYARRCGWRVAHFHDSRRQVASGRFVGDRDAAGFPDLTLVRERIVHVELKGVRTRVTVPQQEWIAALVDAGGEVYVWRVAPDPWPEIHRVLKRNDRATGMPRGP